MNPERAHTVFLLRFKVEPLRKVSTAFLLINPRYCWYLTHGRLLLLLGHQILFHMNLSSPRCTFFWGMTLKEAVSGILRYFRSCCYCWDSRSPLPKKLPGDSNLGGGTHSQTPSLPIPLSVPHYKARLYVLPFRGEYWTLSTSSGTGGHWNASFFVTWSCSNIVCLK